MTSFSDFNFKVFRSLLFITIDGVVDSEDVLRVYCVLDAHEHLLMKGEVYEGVLHESLPKFSNTMMMGDASSILEYFIPDLSFCFFIDFNSSLPVDLLVVKSKVYVNSCSGFIQLSYSETAPDI